MRKSAVCLSVFIALEFFCVGSHAAPAPAPLSDEIIVSPNGATPTEFGNGTSTTACAPATVAPCFNSIDQTIPESGAESSFTSLIGFRSGSNANGNGHDATFNTAVELLDPTTGAISDVIELQIVGNATGADQQWTLVFTSDAEGGAPLTTPTGLVGAPFTLTETGGLQDISGDFLDSRGIDRMSPLFSIQVMSDVEVPEPGSLALLAAGLFGIGLLRRRRLST